MRRMAGLLLAVLASVVLARPAPAQTAGPTTLVADVVRLDGGSRLVAEGDVAVLADGNRLTASRLIYDRAADRLTLEGPVRLETPEGAVLRAASGTLDRDLEEGILRSARVILDQRLQIAAAEAARRDGRFLDARRVVASSCQVCAEGETPLWALRARRVIHDDEAAQIYFYNATFHVAGLPVFYLPALRVPDGTDDRVRGFLVPEFVASSTFGNGLRLPYFVPLGDHADLTLTPFAADGFTRTLGARYRQAFIKGDVSVEGAVSRDSLEDGPRGYLFVDGRFRVRRDFTLRFDVETTSDDQYLRDYDILESDRLDSAVGLSRYRPQQRVSAEFTYFQSLRADVDDSDDPRFLGVTGGSLPPARGERVEKEE